MKITEVRIFKKENVDKKLKAFATITLEDCFVVRDVKVIEGNKGLFVAMPSRRMKQPCPKCQHRNVLRSRYCNNCGTNLDGTSTQPTDDGSRQNEHKDIAHPITLDCREYIQKLVLEAYESEKNNPTSGDRKTDIVGADDFDDMV